MVFSDVHGNLPALELALKDAGRVDGYICLGDIVDYGPWANECVDLVTSLPNTTVVRGNHEDYFLAGEYSSPNQTAKAFFDYCYPSFDRHDKIKNLPEQYELNGFTFRHTILGMNVYPDSDIQLDTNYVVGHSHHQFRLSKPPYTLYNPGSIGQNRRYINVINYMILETDSMQFELKAVIYNEHLILDEMRRRHYPQALIDYYDNKERLAA